MVVIGPNVSNWSNFRARLLITWSRLNHDQLIVIWQLIVISLALDHNQWIITIKVGLCTGAWTVLIWTAVAQHQSNAVWLLGSVQTAWAVAAVSACHSSYYTIRCMYWEGQRDVDMGSAGAVIHEVFAWMAFYPLLPSPRYTHIYFTLQTPVDYAFSAQSIDCDQLIDELHMVKSNQFRNQLIMKSSIN